MRSLKTCVLFCHQYLCVYLSEVHNLFLTQKYRLYDDIHETMSRDKFNAREKRAKNKPNEKKMGRNT